MVFFCFCEHLESVRPSLFSKAVTHILPLMASFEVLNEVQRPTLSLIFEETFSKKKKLFFPFSLISKEYFFFVVPLLMWCRGTLGTRMMKDFIWKLDL